MKVDYLNERGKNEYDLTAHVYIFGFSEKFSWKI